MSKAVILSIGLMILVAGPLSAQWFQQNSRVTFALGDVDFTDTLRGVVSGGEIGHMDTALVTTNGGNFWMFTTRPGGLQRLCMVNVQRGFSTSGAGGGFTFVTTTNGGISWVNTGLVPFGINWIMGLSFVDTVHGWATGADLGGNSYIIATTDGGYNWSLQDTNTKRDLFDVMFVDSLHGWACGYDGGADTLSIVATTDGGRTWAKQRTPWTGMGMFPVFSVFFLDALRGWAAGQDGRTLYTTDGGQRWDVAFAGNVHDVVFADSLFGWEVGRVSGSALIGVSTDGGRTWTLQTSPVTNELRAVDFVGRRKGWIVGDGGVILHTDNGGGAVGVEEAGEQGSKGAGEREEKLTAFPNPTRKEMRLRIRVPEASLKNTESVLRVYDMRGRLVRDLTGALRQGQQGEILWDGRDEKGKVVPTGTYLVKLKAGDREQSRKVVVVR